MGQGSRSDDRRLRSCQPRRQSTDRRSRRHQPAGRTVDDHLPNTCTRISFFGGGTDYPAWYRQHGGAVLATTIDKYSYITCRYLPPFFEHRYCLVYSKMEHCGTIDEIEHPAVREVVRFLNVSRGLEIHHDADLPARSGMGSSSAFTVGLLHALYALTGRMATKHQLASESVHLEQEVLKETVGSQDQVLAAYGGFNHVAVPAQRRDCRDARHRGSGAHPGAQFAPDALLHGNQRTASTIADTYVTGIEEKKRKLRIMSDLVAESMSILNGSHDISAFGELLHEAWQTKRGLSAKVSNPDVDTLYERPPERAHRRQADRRRRRRLLAPVRATLAAAGRTRASIQIDTCAVSVRLHRQPGHIRRQRAGVRASGGGAHPAGNRALPRACSGRPARSH